LPAEQARSLTRLQQIAALPIADDTRPEPEQITLL
jgi:hypothetical protein